MSSNALSDRDSPTRWQSLVFLGKTRLLQLRRGIAEFDNRPPLQEPGSELVGAPVMAETREPLWREITAAEFPLTAGKVENVRRAARAFHGLEIPAGATFSFWRQLGRTTRAKGFTQGRELREGCLIPAIGGGLCQLSGLLYQTARDAGLEIVERHAHSRIIPGSTAEQDLDATVFWNYIDLRFRSAESWRIEVELTAADLVVRFRSRHAARPAPAPPVPDSTPRAAPSGDCLSCGMTSCYRHPAATSAHAPAMGHSTFLLDARWPEFDAWCRNHSRDGDHWFTPLDGLRWKKPNYQWSPPSAAISHTATAFTLLRAFRQRRLPAQGRLRQLTLLAGDAALARQFAARLSPRCRHIVVSQNLLPHLWVAGVMGGRSFDVLMQRWPLDELQRRLDLAKAAHPASTTLGDFRADPALVRAESDALAAAGRLVTPHRDIARHFGSRAWVIDWDMPAPLTPAPSATPSLFFPASRLGRKGAFELADALRRDFVAELRILGRATEDGADPFSGLACSNCGPDALAAAHALVLPAWIEHQPRLALLALASGIPVIATEACGLPPNPLLHTLASPDPDALHSALLSVLNAHPHQRVIS